MGVDRMTAKRFSGEFDNQYSGVYDDGKQLSNFEVVRLLNELHEKNERLQKAVDNCQFRTLDLLDYIKEKETVTHQEIKDWWNSKVME